MPTDNEKTERVSAMRVKRNGRIRFEDLDFEPSPIPNDPKLLWAAARSENRHDRRNIAQVPFDLDLDLLDLLSADQDSAVAEAVASRRQPLTDAMMERLFDGGNVWVKSAILRRKQPIPRSVRLAAAGDEEEVAFVLIERDDLDDEDILNTIFEVQGEFIREDVTRRFRSGALTLRPSHVSVLERDLSPTVRRNMLRALIPAGLTAIEALMDTAQPEWCRAGIATFTTNSRMLRRAVMDESAAVRVAALRNPALPVSADLLRQLRDDADPQVAEAAGDRFLGALSSGPTG